MHLIIVRYFVPHGHLEAEVSECTGRAYLSRCKDCTWYGTYHEPTSPLPPSRDTSVGSYI
jgi:hypothetical protein